MSHLSAPFSESHFSWAALTLSTPTIGPSFSRTTSDLIWPSAMKPVFSRKQLAKHLTLASALSNLPWRRAWACSLVMPSCSAQAAPLAFALAFCSSVSCSSYMELGYRAMDVLYFNRVVALTWATVRATQATRTIKNFMVYYVVSELSNCLFDALCDTLLYHFTWWTLPTFRIWFICYCFFSLSLSLFSSWLITLIHTIQKLEVVYLTHALLMMPGVCWLLVLCVMILPRPPAQFATNC